MANMVPPGVYPRGPLNSPVPQSPWLFSDPDSLEATADARMNPPPMSPRDVPEFASIGSGGPSMVPPTVSDHVQGYFLGATPGAPLLNKHIPSQSRFVGPPEDNVSEGPTNDALKNLPPVIGGKGRPSGKQGGSGNHGMDPLEQALAKAFEAAKKGDQELADRLMAQAEAIRNKEAQLDLSPMMALSDTWFGGDLLRGYKRPTSREDLEKQAQGIQNTSDELRLGIPKKDIALLQAQLDLQGKKAAMEQSAQQHRESLENARRIAEMNNDADLLKAGVAGKSKKPLSGEEMKRYDFIKGALREVKAARSAWRTGQKNPLYGENEYTIHKRLFGENYGRLNSQGAITADELVTFANMLPTFKDEYLSPEQVDNKFNAMERELTDRLNTVEKETGRGGGGSGASDGGGSGASDGGSSRMYKGKKYNHTGGSWNDPANWKVEE